MTQLNKFSQALLEECKAAIAQMSPAELAYEITTLRKEWPYHSEIQKQTAFQTAILQALNAEISKRRGWK